MASRAARRGGCACARRVASMWRRAVVGCGHICRSSGPWHGRRRRSEAGCPAVLAEVRVWVVERATVGARPVAGGGPWAGGRAGRRERRGRHDHSRCGRVCLGGAARVAELRVGGGLDAAPRARPVGDRGLRAGSGDAGLRGGAGAAGAAVPAEALVFRNVSSARWTDRHATPVLHGPRLSRYYSRSREAKIGACVSQPGPSDDACSAAVMTLGHARHIRATQPAATPASALSR